MFHLQCPPQVFLLGGGKKRKEMFIYELDDLERKSYDGSDDFSR